MIAQELEQMRAHLAEEGVDAKMQIEARTNDDIREFIIWSRDESGALGGLEEVQRVLTMTGWLNERSGGRLLDIISGSEYTEHDSGARQTFLWLEDQPTASS